VLKKGRRQPSEAMLAILKFKVGSLGERSEFEI
jgi:hypothetical protein